MVGEERRAQGQKRRPAELCQTWLWLLTVPGQEGKGQATCQPSSAQQPDPQLWLRYVQEVEPCLSVSFPKFSRTKASPCFSGDHALTGQISDFFLTASLIFHATPSIAVNWKQFQERVLLNWYPLVRATLLKCDTLLARYFPFPGTSLIFTSLRRYFVHTQNKTGLCNCSFTFLSNPRQCSTSPTTDVLEHQICTMSYMAHLPGGKKFL